MPASPSGHHTVLIVGGGAAGVTAAHLLHRQRPHLKVALLEPSSEHFYQPGWTLVGGGVMSMEQTQRPEGELIPKGVQWIQAAATRLDPDHNRVQTSSGTSLT